MTPIEAKSTPEPNSGCWLWDLSLSGSGYGQISYNGKQRMAHRVSWELYRGPVPDETCVCHHCDVKSCVNPDHLFLGTHADNSADKLMKGRQARGAGHGSAKLSEADVRSIRVAAGSQSSIARRFGISQQRVWDIKRTPAWKHVGE